MRAPLGSTTMNDPYRDYAKPTSPYKKMAGMRPRSAKPRLGEHGAPMIRNAAKNNKVLKKIESIKYGFSRPLHLQLAGH